MPAHSCARSAAGGVCHPACCSSAGNGALLSPRAVRLRVKGRRQGKTVLLHCSSHAALGVPTFYCTGHPWGMMHAFV